MPVGGHCLLGLPVRQLCLSSSPTDGHWPLSVPIALHHPSVLPVGDQHSLTHGHNDLAMEIDGTQNLPSDALASQFLQHGTIIYLLVMELPRLLAMKMSITLLKHRGFQQAPCGLSRRVRSSQRWHCSCREGLLVWTHFLCCAEMLLLPIFFLSSVVASMKLAGRATEGTMSLTHVVEVSTDSAGPGSISQASAFAALVASWFSSEPVTPSHLMPCHDHGASSFLAGQRVASQKLAGAVLPHFVGYRDHSEINSYNNSEIKSMSDAASHFSAGVQSQASKKLAGKGLA